MPVRAVLFDAGHTLLEMDYAAVTSALAARGHTVTQGRHTHLTGKMRAKCDGSLRLESQSLARSGPASDPGRRTWGLSPRRPWGCSTASYENAMG